MKWLSVIYLVVLFGMASIVNAQTIGGSLAGSVLDSAGRPVPSAAITVTNTRTGVSYPAATSSSGVYNVINLIPGVYDVQASAPGFKVGVETNIIIEANATAAANITLQLGSVSQTVTVEATNVGIQTQSSAVTTSVTSRLVQDMPLVNTDTQAGVRSPVDLMFLTPGIQGNLFENRIAGGQAIGGDVEVDGISLDVSSGGNYDAPQMTPSVDAIQEFSVVTAGYPAEYGRTSGGIVTFVTKSGTNSFHGGGYDIIRNTDFDANSWFNNHYLTELCTGANDTPGCRAMYTRPADNKNNFGATLGGPVWIPHLYHGRDKTFFFFSWEQARVKSGGLTVITLPTAANRAGDFSQNLVTSNVLVAQNPCDNNNPIYQGEIFDPSTTQTINGVACRKPFDYNGQLNVMPPTAISTVAQNILNYVPLPQSSSIVNNYQSPYTVANTGTLETIRIDHVFGNKDRIFGSYNTNEFTGNYGDRAIPGPADASGTEAFFTHTETFGYTHIFSSSLENFFNIGGFRFPVTIFSVAVPENIDWPAKLGISGLSGLTFPTIEFTQGDYRDLGFAENYYAPQNYFALNDSVSWIKGKHTFKFGYDGRYEQYSDISNGADTGAFVFAPAETSGIATSPVQNGNAFASFQLGQINSASAANPLHNPRFNSWYQGVYVQDDFKVSPTLMLNVGLRYDVDLPTTEASNDSSIFSPNTPNPGAGELKGAQIFSGTGPGRSGLKSSWVTTTYSDIAPRIGFSWAPEAAHQKTAIRGSYDILYGAVAPSNYTSYTQMGFTATSDYTDASSVGGFSGTPFTLDTAYPPLSTTVNFDPSQFNGEGTFYAQRNAKPPKVQIWNLQVQQEIVPDLVFTLGYVGNHATRLESDLRDINAVPSQDWALGSTLLQPVVGNTYGIPVPYAGFSGGSIANALRPYPQYLHIGAAVESVGQSHYNALWATLQRRYRNGLTLLASYTWSKTMTDADTVITSFDGGGYVQNPFDLKGENALSQFDIPNSLSVSYAYELPFGENKTFLAHSHILNTFVGGWIVSGIQSYGSSTPISFGCADQIPGTDNCVRWNHFANTYLSNKANKASFNPDTDNQFLNPGQSYQQLWFDPEASLSSGGGYQLGNVTRYTSARGPFLLNENFSVSKETPIREGIRAEIRGEFFNAFNRHQFGIDNSIPNSPGFGQVTATSDLQRQLQLTGRIIF